MPHETWSSVDAFIAEHLIPADESLEKAVSASEAAGLPSIQVSAAQGKFLHLLARIHGAKKILEIGTLGGYSTIWLARALPADGKLITLEYDPKHAEVATTNIAKAGLASKVEVRVGKALDTLPGVEAEGPFDFIFIDADKVNTPGYFEWALKLTSTGGVIIVDNVIRKGAVVNPHSTDADVLAMREFFDNLKHESRVSATVMQTVGSKGYDGFAIAYVLA